MDEQGAPVLTYKLAVVPTHATASYRYFEVSSSTGAFAVRGLAADSYALVVTTTDGRCGRLADVAVSSGEHAGGLRITIDEGVVIRGRLVDATDGSPLPGGSVTVFGVPPHPIDGAVDDDGSFAITGIPTGTEVTVVASAPAHAAAAPSIPQQGNAGVVELGDLRLESAEHAPR